MNAQRRSGAAIAALAFLLAGDALAYGSAWPRLVAPPHGAYLHFGQPVILHGPHHYLPRYRSRHGHGRWHGHGHGHGHGQGHARAFQSHRWPGYQAPHLPHRDYFDRHRHAWPYAGGSSLFFHYRY